MHPPPKLPGPSKPPGPPRLRPDLAARAAATFNSALDFPVRDRATFVAKECAGEDELHKHVRRLLAAQEEAEGFLGEPAMMTEIEEELARHKPEEGGDRIGPYKLMEQIGEGGFGTVWVADQEKPVRRRVALKIIKLGMDTKEVIARFEQERQALAMMDHPNIAKVLDAGATQHGRPYFVMELVRGVKITDYCDDQQLSTAERIELFITVCQAVQHAHQKGIIHRDLKPSNILVTINDGEAVPKVIDFGVAKATQGRLVEQTVYTQFQQMIGTPLYMSPEQAELTSLDIDTRSDIYSLGVLLYELLTGHTPIDQHTMARVGMDEMRRMIREVDPLRPSMRVKTLDGVELTTAAKRRHTDPAKLPGTLRGDIDWIVMKCLEKDRKRRYDTANGLALDLQRHLKNEVVVARPPTTAYLLSKLVKRNLSAVFAGGTVLMALIIGFAVAVWQARRAEHEAKRSAAAFDELRASAPAFAEQARGLAAREQYGDAIAKLDYAIKLRPDVAEYVLAKADLLQCELELTEAVAVYREAVRVKPSLARAEASAKLCEEILAAPLSDQGKLTRESLAKLHLAMQRQQRPAAELLPVARLLGEEKKLLVEYWLARLKDLPVSTERPLKERLTVRDDGRLALDLSDTKVIDLSPLAGAPLAVLNVSSTKQLSELSDLAPLRGIDLVELDLKGTSVADLTPLREMHALRKLDLGGTKVTDLAQLNTLRLEELDLRGTRIFDLAALREMKLQKLSLRDTRVADLSPLAGMPLTYFDATTIPATDYSPLTGAPLEKLLIQSSPLRDLSFLQDSPVKELVLFSCNELRGFSVLAGLKSLDLLVLPQSFRSLPDEDFAAIGALRTHPTLRNIQTEYRSSGGWIINTTQSKETFWQDWDREESFVSVLRRSGFKFSFQKLPAGTYSLSIQNQPLSDLSILKGVPVSELHLSKCKFTDLAPIRDLKLEVLNLTSDLVADLSPLHGMPLKTLSLNGTKISDLTPLAGLPLRELYLHGCPKVTDVSPLAEIPTLEKLTVPLLAGKIEALRKLTRLQMLAFNRSDDGIPASTTEDFWKDNAANGWLSRLRESGFKLKTLKRLEDGTWDVNLEGAAITDLTILQGAPISRLSLGYTPVSDLTPLHGMGLKLLHIVDTKVVDLSPLRGMPLETLNLIGTKVTDLSLLRELPLTSLRLNGCTEITDLSPLADCKALTALTLPSKVTNIDFLRTFPKLERISFDEDAKNGWRPDKTAVEFWKEYDAQGWMRALRASGLAIQTLVQLSDGKWQVDLSKSDLKDLAMLQGAPISDLNIGNTAVADLTPLRGMPLNRLVLNETKVIDLSPIKGLPIEKLYLSRTKVTDLSALRGMPLIHLTLRFSAGITDFSPLSEIVSLRNLILPSNAKNIEMLRGLPKLERLGYTDAADPSGLPAQPVGDFWKEYDARGK